MPHDHPPLPSGERTLEQLKTSPAWGDVGPDRVAPFAGRPWNTELADAIAAAAHAGVFDKVGDPYIDHPRTVAKLCVPYGDAAVQVGLLHDVVEDTVWTLADLAYLGAPEDVLFGVDSVTKHPARRERRPQAVRRAGSDPIGNVVKAADNAHNGHPERNARVTDEQSRARMAANYAADRAVLDECGAPRFDLEQALRA